jgi:plastocyanin
VIRRLVPILAFASSASLALGALALPAEAAGASVKVQNFAFNPPTSMVTRGAAVKWTFLDGTAHTSTDASGMNLWDSGHRASGSFSETFVAAGAYAYHCTVHSFMTGTVMVPVTASPATGSTSTSFTITWSSAAPPAGFVFDVQVKQPGSSTFTTFKKGVTKTSAHFTATAKGTYSFHARLRRPSVGKSSGYSATASITVH